MYVGGVSVVAVRSTGHLDLHTWDSQNFVCRGTWQILLKKKKTETRYPLLHHTLNFVTPVKEES